MHASSPWPSRDDTGRVESLTAKPGHSPISDLWTISIRPQQCIDHGVHLLVASIINTVQDFLIVLVPIKTVVGLNLPLAQRVTVLVLFAGGLLVCIAGAVRTHFTWRMVSSPDGDINWHAYDMMLASSIELFLGIVRLSFPTSRSDLEERLMVPPLQICASAPATKPFFARYIPHLFRMARHGSGGAVGREDKTHHYSTSRASSAYICIVRDIENPWPVSVRLGREASRGSGPVLPPDLNKPLPSFPKPILKVSIDRSFAWDEGGSPRSPSSVLF